MALLLILFALVGFILSGVGSGSSGVSDRSVGSGSSTAATSKSCSTVVSTVNGKTVRRRSCSSTSGGSATVHSRVVVKCSVQMTNGTKKSHCSAPVKP